ncbi:MAG: hypothetical protein ACI81L_002080 [Verrucomicrobiales bacterium]|jgi:hypothetical protein
MSQLANYSQLLSAEAVRSQCARVTARTRNGGGLFIVDDDAIDACAQRVVDVTRERYPTLDIPYHSRWRHFRTAEATALETQLLGLLSGLDPLEAARVGFDLVIPSVLLDAGAGPDWAFHPPDTEVSIGRSEGLGLGSLDMFLRGAFSSDGSARTDAAALSAFTEEQLRSGFQVSDDNPLVGLAGRLDLLRRLGSAIAAQPAVFPNGRPGDLISSLISTSDRSVSARDLLGLVLDALSPVWPSGRSNGTVDVELGDSWHYAPFGNGPDSIIPFHKLSQWLTYSLAETCERSGIVVTHLDTLTGLPEYRNGGLLYETGVLSLRNPSAAEGKHAPGSELIIEWRALTVTLLDEVAALVRTKLDRPTMLLAEILEGGTWAAGRALAFARTPDGSPPLHLDSDGTVF